MALSARIIEKASLIIVWHKINSSWGKTVPASQVFVFCKHKISVCVPLMESEGKRDPSMVVVSKTEAYILNVNSVTTIASFCQFCAEV